MKNIKTLILLLLLASTGFGQSLSPRVTATAGGRATGGGVSLSYTTGETFNTKLSANNQQLTQGQQQPEINLRVGITQAFACAGNNISVPFTADGYVDAANTFIVQLSDANGSFANAVTIGSATSMVSGNITATVPTGLNGSGYKARVVSSNPSRISSDLITVTVNAIPNPVATVTQPSCASATGTINVTSPIGAGLTYSIGGAYQSSTTFSGVLAGTYNVSVQNGAGCSSEETTSVTVNPQPIAPGIVTLMGQANVCNVVGTGTALTYTASSPGATSYTWSLPPYVSLVGQPASSSITTYTGLSNTISVTFSSDFISPGSSNKQIRVRAASSCGLTAISVFYLTAVRPTTPSTIVVSNTNVCPSIGTSVPITYRIPKVTSAQTYVWEMTTNGVPSTTSTINDLHSGANDTAVSIAFASNYSTSVLSVYTVNDCGTSANSRSITITRANPSTPGLISGPTNACEYSGITGLTATYSVTAASNVDSYTWTLPVGVTDVVGQGTNTIAFRYPTGFLSGSVSVVAVNGCGNSGSRTLNVTRLTPTTPSNIDVINTALCPNRVYTYSIAAMPSNTRSLEWSVPSGGTIVGGQGTISITVSYAAGVIDGKVSVRSINNCGVSSYKNSNIKLSACATGRTLDYTKVDTKFKTAAIDVKVFPNPTTATFNVQVISTDSKEINVRILDVQGRFIKSMTIASHQTISIGSELKAGVYMLEVKQGVEVKTVRLVKY